MSVSTHVLDAMSGLPAADVSVRLESLIEGSWQVTGEGLTNVDGRIGQLGTVTAGRHRLTFGTGEYFARRAVPAFYPEVTITFETDDSDRHYHVPLLLSPFAFSTYRGS